MRLFPSMKRTLYLSRGIASQHVPRWAVVKLLYKGKLEEAVQLLLKTSFDEKEREYKICGDYFIREMMKSNMYSPEQVFQVCDRLKEINCYSFQTAAEVSVFCRDKETIKLFVKRFIQECQVLRPHYFSPILAKCVDIDQVLQVLTTDMKEQQFPSDSLSDTFVDYVWPKCPKDKFDSVVEICLSLGYSMPFLLTTYVRHLLDLQDLQTTLQVLRDPKYSNEKLLQESLMRYVAKAAASAGSVEDVVSLVKQVNERNTDYRVSDQNGVFISFFLHFAGNKRIVKEQFFLDILLRKMLDDNMVISEKYHDTLSKNPSLTSFQMELIDKMSVFNRPPSMRLDANQDVLPQTITDLEQKLQDLQNESKSSFETRDCITKLLIEYCKHGVASKVREESRVSVGHDYQRVTTRVSELLKLLKSNRVPISDGLKSICYEFFATFADFDSCKQMRFEMSPEFVVNDFKVMSVAKYFIRSGRIQEAIALLEEDIDRRQRIGYQENSFLKESTKEIHVANFVRCVNEAAEKTRDAKTVDRIFDLCLQLRRMKPIRGMLGPKIRVHLLNNDLEAAVKTFVDVAHEFQETPFMAELMIRLMQAKDPNLQKVVDVASDLHGRQAVSAELAFVCMEIGKTENAANILKKVGVSMVKISNKAEILIKRKDFEGLETMMSVLKTIPGVDQRQIQDFLTRGRILKQAHQQKKTLEEIN